MHTLIYFIQNLHTLIYFWFLCRKIEKCNFWVKLMQKGLLGRDYEDNHEERDQTTPFGLKTMRRDQNAPFRFSTACGDLIAKFSKMWGAKCDS